MYYPISTSKHLSIDLIVFETAEACRREMTLIITLSIGPLIVLLQKHYRKFLVVFLPPY
jgi:hypothetical protein